MTKSVAKFWLMAAVSSTRPEQKKPHTMIWRRPSVSDRKPHTIADDIIPGNALLVNSAYINASSKDNAPHQNIFI